MRHREPRATAEVPGRRVAVVTDSTACLEPEEAARRGVVVVPLDVTIDGIRYREGEDLPAAALAAALGRGARVTTSQPPPAAFVAAYARAVEAGASEIVSIHLSGELSGTVRSAGLAAQIAPVPVHVVDSRSVGLGLGFAVLTAAGLCGPPAAEDVADSATGAPWWRTVRAGWRPRRPESAAGPEPVADPGVVAGLATYAAAVAEQVGRSASVWFLVESLDHLRRGGRLGATAAALGTVLGLRPLLVLRDGRVEVAERTRTRRASRERLERLVVADAAARPGARVGVHHLGQGDLAAELAAELAVRTGCGDVVVREVGAVIGAHAGPGVLAVVVADA